MAPPALLVEPWTARRRRTEALRERYPFALEILDLYRALLDVQEPAFAAARADRPAASGLPGYVVERVLPAVADTTCARGPVRLSALVRRRVEGGDLAELVSGWLIGVEQSPVDRFLARAATTPVLEALGEAAGAACPGPRDRRHCPICGGLPQVSYSAPSAEALVTSQRHLVCARCMTSWPYPRMTCAACGETEGSRLTVYAEEGAAEAQLSGRIIRGVGAVEPEGPLGDRPRFPHIRIEACTTCSRYLLGVDLTRDPRAVPVVDDLAAVPLDLYAVDRGFAKIMPNFMGV
ncbi:MAG TPA: formate dehydrogenase accessory protein FdhE [bacterium]|nr:formate dehydrogenase accessory protein FdhE [bacterium]